MMCLPDGKTFTISLAVLTEYRPVTDKETDGQTYVPLSMTLSARMSLCLSQAYGHRYFGMRIGNFTQTFEWYHFQ